MQSFNPNIRFVGTVDDNLDLFEGQYPIPKGISYNSYLILDDRLAIVDAVDKRRRSDWLAALDDALDGRQPDYLIVQHVEPDHSASVVDALRRYPGMKMVATAKAVAMMGNFHSDFDFASRSIVVKEGDTLPLGRATLEFFGAPMVHWPEVMMTLDAADGVLFSADAFGTFATPSSPEAWDDEARRYYCNIVGKYGANVQAIMKKLSTRKFSTVCPLHGPVLRDNLAHYWQLYDKWSRWEPETEGVLVAYASVYGGTATAARRLAAMLEEEGEPEVVLMDLSRHDVSYAVAEAFRLNKLALCSVTYDAALFPAMYNFLHHLHAKNFKGRRVALVENGSWAPVAAKLMRDQLAGMKDMEVVEPVVTLRSRMTSENSAQLRILARTLALAGE